MAVTHFTQFCLCKSWPFWPQAGDNAWSSHVSFKQLSTTFFYSLQTCVVKKKKKNHSAGKSVYLYICIHDDQYGINVINFQNQQSNILM